MDITSSLDFKQSAYCLDTEGIMGVDLLPFDLSQPVGSCIPSHPLTLWSNIGKEFKFAINIW